MSTIAAVLSRPQVAQDTSTYKCKAECCLQEMLAGTQTTHVRKVTAFCLQAGSLEVNALPCNGCTRGALHYNTRVCCTAAGGRLWVCCSWALGRQQTHQALAVCAGALAGPAWVGRAGAHAQVWAHRISDVWVCNGVGAITASCRLARQQHHVPARVQGRTRSGYGCRTLQRQRSRSRNWRLARHALCCTCDLSLTNPPVGKVATELHNAGITRRTKPGLLQVILLLPEAVEHASTACWWTVQGTGALRATRTSYKTVCCMC
jgi:hypothetical protein